MLKALFLTLFMTTSLWAADQCPVNLSIESVVEDSLQYSALTVKQLSVTKWFKPLGKPKGVMLTVHGLNNKPDNLNVISNYFSKQGIAVLRVGLLGHRSDSHEAGLVNTEQVRRQIFLNYCLVESYANTTNVPMYFLGNSLGGSILMNLVETQKIQLQKIKHIFLLAPSIRLHGKALMTRLATVLPSNWSLPSQADAGYRANKYTPFALYELVWDFYSRNKVSEFKISSNVPVSVFMDSRDILIDYDEVNALVSGHSKWSMNLINTDKAVVHKNTYHHLIDAKGMGDKEFQRMMLFMASKL